MSPHGSGRLSALMHSPGSSEPPAHGASSEAADGFGRATSIGMSLRAGIRDAMRSLKSGTYRRSLSTDPPSALKRLDTHLFHGVGSGKVVEELYTLGHEIGKGAFGVVREATCKTTGTRLCCKSIPRASLTPEMFHDIQIEAEIMMHIRGHPNVVEIYGMFEDVTHIHIVEEMCSGGDLYSKLTKTPVPYTEKEVAAIMHSVLVVLQHCHSMGVLYRDCKPDNFLLSSKGPDAILKATDFGISRFIKPGEMLEEFCGTPSYMAPEVFDMCYSFPSDVWAAGIMMYWVLCGEFPFKGKTKMDLARRVYVEPPNMTGAVWEQVTPEAKDFVRLMLTKDPRKRPLPAELLQHRWFKMMAVAKVKPLGNIVLQRMRTFAESNEFKKEVLRFIARSLDDAYLVGLRSMFSAMDVDGSGTLSIDEVLKALEMQGVKVDMTEVKALMDTIDDDHSGTIEFHEFVSATINSSVLERRELLRAAFDHYDANHDGSISVAELEQALTRNHRLSEKKIKKVIASIDNNRDGQIDFQEFCNMMLESKDQGRDGFKLRWRTHSKSSASSSPSIFANAHKNSFKDLPNLANYANRTPTGISPVNKTATPGLGGLNATAGEPLGYARASQRMLITVTATDTAHDVSQAKGGGICASGRSFSHRVRRASLELLGALGAPGGLGTAEGAEPGTLLGAAGPGSGKGLPGPASMARSSLKRSSLADAVGHAHSKSMANMSAWLAEANGSNSNNKSMTAKLSPFRLMSLTRSSTGPSAAISSPTKATPGSHEPYVPLSAMERAASLSASKFRSANASRKGSTAGIMQHPGDSPAYGSDSHHALYPSSSPPSPLNNGLPPGDHAAVASSYAAPDSAGSTTGAHAPHTHDHAVDLLNGSTTGRVSIPRPSALRKVSMVSSGSGAAPHSPSPTGVLMPAGSPPGGAAGGGATPPASQRATPRQFKRLSWSPALEDAQQQQQPASPAAGLLRPDGSASLPPPSPAPQQSGMGSGDLAITTTVALLHVQDALGQPAVPGEAPSPHPLHVPPHPHHSPPGQLHRLASPTHSQLLNHHPISGSADLLPALAECAGEVAGASEAAAATAVLAAIAAAAAGAAADGGQAGGPGAGPSVLSVSVGQMAEDCGGGGAAAFILPALPDRILLASAGHGSDALTDGSVTSATMSVSTFAGVSSALYQRSTHQAMSNASATSEDYAAAAATAAHQLGLRQHPFAQHTAGVAGGSGGVADAGSVRPGAGGSFLAATAVVAAPAWHTAAAASSSALASRGPTPEGTTTTSSVASSMQQLQLTGSSTLSASADASPPPKQPAPFHLVPGSKQPLMPPSHAAAAAAITDHGGETGAATVVLQPHQPVQPQTQGPPFPMASALSTLTGSPALHPRPSQDGGLVTAFSTTSWPMGLPPRPNTPPLSPLSGGSAGVTGVVMSLTSQLYQSLEQQQHGGASAGSRHESQSQLAVASLSNGVGSGPLVPPRPAASQASSSAGAALGGQVSAPVEDVQGASDAAAAQGKGKGLMVQVGSSDMLVLGADSSALGGGGGGGGGGLPSPSNGRSKLGTLKWPFKRSSVDRGKDCAIM